jgi:hypothetical protein
MNDVQQRTVVVNPRRAWRFLFAIIGGVVLFTVVAFIWQLPQRLSAGQVVDQFGTYRFPTGRRTLQIAKDDFGNVTVSVSRQMRRFYVIPYTVTAPQSTFESERDWFVCVDKYQRLWVYHGHWDRAWGKLRQMPSGGTIPYAPAVIMHGSWFGGPGRLFDGGNVVTESGDWAGVPQQFFDRIPSRDGAQWGNVPPVPTSAIQFDAQQEIQIENHLRRAR